MANLTELEEYTAGIYRFEETDPVEGGPGGIDNLPTNQLANRTKWLKARVDALLLSLASLNLELYAPLESPIFTDNPQAPTAAQFDNDTSLATTAFVQRALGNWAGFSIVSASSSLNAASCGKVIQLNDVTMTVTLPSTEDLPDGAAIYLFLVGTGNKRTIAPAVGDTITAWGSTPLALVFNRPGDLLFVKRANEWRIVGGSHSPEAISGSEIQTVPATGTVIEMTDIPPWVNEVEITFNGVRTTGSAGVIIQIGDSGGYETTGYLGYSAACSNGSSPVVGNNSIGFGVLPTHAPSYVMQGNATVRKYSADGLRWGFSSSVGLSNTQVFGLASGGKHLSGRFDRLRILTTNGVDLFDLGNFGLRQRM